MTGNGSLYLLLGTVVAQIGGLVLYWLRDRSSARKERERRQYEIEDRKQLVKHVEQVQEEAIAPIRQEINGAAKDRQKLLGMLEGHQKDLQETKNLVKKQVAPRDKNARERLTDRIVPDGEGDKRRQIRRATDSHTAATSKLAQATDQAATATTNLADTVQNAAEEQKAAAREIALVTAKVAIRAAETAETIAANSTRSAAKIEEIASTVKRIEEKNKD